MYLSEVAYVCNGEGDKGENFNKFNRISSRLDARGTSRLTPGAPGNGAGVEGVNELGILHQSASPPDCGRRP